MTGETEDQTNFCVRVTRAIIDLRMRPLFEIIQGIQQDKFKLDNRL